MFFVSKIKNTNGEMKLNIAAWPRALGSSLSHSLKEALLPVLQMFVCTGASHVHAMCNLNQAETEEFMNELYPPRPFPHWQCLVLLLRSQQGQTLVSTLCTTAWLDCSSMQVGGVKELRLGVCSPWLCGAGRFCLVGKDGGNGSTQRCYNCDWI